MRKNVRKPREFEIRIIEKFLFFPKRIVNEVRWFEKVRIKQRFNNINFDKSKPALLDWVDLSWVDDEPIKKIKIFNLEFDYFDNCENEDKFVVIKGETLKQIKDGFYKKMKEINYPEIYDVDCCKLKGNINEIWSKINLKIKKEEFSFPLIITS